MDIQRHNISWEDYMAKINYDPSAAGSFTGVDELDTFNKRENMLSASTRCENG